MKWALWLFPISMFLTVVWIVSGFAALINPVIITEKDIIIGGIYTFLALVFCVVDFKLEPIAFRQLAEWIIRNAGKGEK